VFPEVETEIDHSAMFKVEGHLTGEAMGTAARRDEGWILMIPMEREGETFTSGKRSDMLKWLAGKLRRLSFFCLHAKLTASPLL